MNHGYYEPYYEPYSASAAAGGRGGGGGEHSGGSRGAWNQRHAARAMRTGGSQTKLQEAQANLNQFRQQAQELAQQGQEEQLAPLQAKAVEAVKAVAEDKGIDLVVPKNNVIFSSDALEISDAVIAVLNSGE